MPNPNGGLLSLFMGGVANAFPELTIYCKEWPKEEISAYRNSEDYNDTEWTVQFGCKIHKTQYLAIVDLYGKVYPVTSCTECEDGYVLASRSFQPTNCKGQSSLNPDTIYYNECVEPTYSTSCDEGQYYDPSIKSCVSCPTPVDIKDEDGYSLTVGYGEACGLWNEEFEEEKPISSCRIVASGCGYCDAAGCFTLSTDCYYSD